MMCLLWIESFAFLETLCLTMPSYTLPMHHHVVVMTALSKKQWFIRCMPI